MFWQERERKYFFFFSEAFGKAESLEIFPNLTSCKTTQHVLLFGEKEKPCLGWPSESHHVPSPDGVSHINSALVRMPKLSFVLPPWMRHTAFWERSQSSQFLRKYENDPWRLTAQSFIQKLLQTWITCSSRIHGVCVCWKPLTNKLPWLDQTCRQRLAETAWGAQKCAAASPA